MEQQDGGGRSSGSRGILKKRRRMEEKEDPMMEESKLKAVKEELREKGGEELEDLMEEESEEDQTTEEEDDQTTDEEEEEAVRYDPRIWSSDPSKFKLVQLKMYGEDYDDDLEPKETEMEMETETVTTGSHEEEQKGTFVYESGNFIGRDDYWAFENIPKLSTLQGPWVIDISIKEEIKRNRILDLYARELAEKSTLDMYQALLKDPEKAKALPDDFKEKVKFVMEKIQEDPNFQISTYDEDMMEFTFNQFPRKNWVAPYDQLQVIRNKENGERVVASGFFDSRAYRERFCDEDTDEQYVAMHEYLQAYLNRECPKADVLRLNDRCMMWKQTITHVKDFWEIRWPRLNLKDIALCGVLIIRTLERNRLAEEYRKTKWILWEFHRKKKAGRRHPDVRAELNKLVDIGIELLSRPEFPGWRAIWDSMVGVRSDREWSKKIDLEYEQDRRQTKEMYDIADHLKLKRKVAMDIGIWKVSLEDFYKRICGGEMSRRVAEVFSHCLHLPWTKECACACHAGGGDCKEEF